jgi:osmotically-inducible protein OsmY
MPESRSDRLQLAAPGVAAALRIAGALLVAGSVSACSPIGMAIGAGATVTNMAMEERGLGNAVRDDAIWADINTRLLNRSQSLFLNVDLTVHEGRVLLTGFVAQPEDRVEATRIAWEVDGVREVVTDVKVGRTRDLGDFSEDTLLVQEINLKLMVDRDIRAINYSVDCVRSTVYLMGVARTPAELQRVIDHVRDVPYVRAVVSHVRVRTDPLPPIPETPPTIAEPSPQTGLTGTAQAAPAPQSAAGAVPVPYSVPASRAVAP